jgi:hypothetical protein
MKHSIRKLGWICALSLLWLCVLLTNSSANDTSLNLKVSPPQLLGEGETPVRMASEHITIHFGAPRSQVEVEFRFKNLADYPVDCWAGFPDEDLMYRYIAEQLAAGVTEDELFDKYEIDDMLVYGEVSGDIQHFTAWTRAADNVHGARTPLPYELMKIESLASTAAPNSFPKGEWTPAPPGSLLMCRAFKLHLEPGQELVVGHSYDSATGGNVEMQSLFQYQLVTGRNWAGTIGEAVIDVYLDASLSKAGLYFGGTNLPEGYPRTKPGKDVLKPVAPGHYHAVWRDFEPDGERGWIFLATKPRSEMEGGGENMDDQTP